MTDKELKLKLLKGLDVEYEGILLRHYKIGEIVENLGSDKYDYLISLTILDVKDVFKDSKVENIDNLKLYDLICTSFEFNNWFIEFLNTFTYMEWEFGKFNDFISYVDGKRIRITESKFDGLMELVRKMYSVSRGSKSNSKFDPSKAVDEETRKIVEELAEAERKHKQKRRKNNKGITLIGIINGVCSKSNSYDLFNIWNLTVYQLMVQYYGIEQDENYGYILSSIYAGVYDLKKNGTNLETLHWANEIDLEK